jgi:cation diffusion facilitator CzcD-associated flavoprotein CzcO
MTPEQHLDVLIVGAGFSGIYILQRLRTLNNNGSKNNLRLKILDSGQKPGGTWHNNRYPGARVDCPIPSYGFGHEFEDVWHGNGNGDGDGRDGGGNGGRGWEWSELYPGRDELTRYFGFVDDVLDISKDCGFGVEVKSARFDKGDGRWVVRAVSKDPGQGPDQGLGAGEEMLFRAKYFIPAVGFASQQYTPPWPGLDSFRGEMHHSSDWPEERVDVRGKRVAVIGTGSSGVQIVQEWAKEATETVVFQRTPNLCIPMRQEVFADRGQRDAITSRTAGELATCQTTGTGLPFGPPEKMFADYPTREDAEAELNDRLDKGGLRYAVGAYLDMLISPEANRAAYDVWAARTRARIVDPVKRDLLAPLDPPHPFGMKRPSLEQDYYEQFNKENVRIVNTAAHPIVEVVPDGVVTADGALHRVDVIALATGFDSSTGSLARMDIRGVDGGPTLGERWATDGVESFLGLTVPGFPNMFLPYGAQAPTPFTNGPVFIESQADWIRDLVGAMERDGRAVIGTRPEAARAWRDEVQAISNLTLFSQAKSWYMGANIPGKRVEQQYYLGGMPVYRARCAEALGEKFGECFECW